MTSRPMTDDEIAEVLAKPYSRQLLDHEQARLAYIGLDADPRVIPIGFWMERRRIVMATAANAAKVPALIQNPNVALTIDTSDFPPRALLIRGTAEVEIVEGVPEGYLLAGRKVLSGEEYEGWVNGARGLYDEMAVISVRPTWAKLLDFETTLPKAVEELIAEKSAG